MSGFGTWERSSCVEFDVRWPKRVLVKMIAEKNDQLRAMGREVAVAVTNGRRLRELGSPQAPIWGKDLESPSEPASQR